MSNVAILIVQVQLPTGVVFLTVSYLSKSKLHFHSSKTFVYRCLTITSAQRGGTVTWWTNMHMFPANPCPVIDLAKEQGTLLSSSPSHRGLLLRNNLFPPLASGGVSC